MRAYRAWVSIRVLAFPVLAAALVTSACATAQAEITPPPPHAGFDYQIARGYPPPSGAEVVSRDHGDEPAPGVYNICYVNAFQAQPGAEAEWGDLLLRDGNGEVVYDEEWGEAILDTRTEAKRTGIAEKVGDWVDECADKGFDAVEPDNYDSFARVPDNLLRPQDNEALIRLLSAHAHERGLAIGQKNTPELAAHRVANGLDFAVAEECGQFDECGVYATAFDDNVVVIEYTREGLSKACAEWGTTLSIVLRDVAVSTPDDDSYVRETCSPEQGP